MGLFPYSKTFVVNVAMPAGRTPFSGGPHHWTRRLFEAEVDAWTNLASTDAGMGASQVGIEDLSGYFTSTTVEGALAELAASIGGGGGTPAGNPTEIQFNNGLSFGADSNFTFDGTNLTVATGGSAIDIGQGFITGGPNLNVETMIGGVLTLSGDAVDILIASELRINGSAGAAGEILTSNGPGVAPSWQPGGITELTGDVTAGPGAGSQAATVVALQGNSVSSVSPDDGQVLTWNGSAWVPGAPATGGSGGGGQTWFLNAGTAGAAPTTGLPASVMDFDLTAETGITTVTSGMLPTGGVYAFVAGFVTGPLEPGLTQIPAGVWDFNVWAQSSAPQPNTTSFRVNVYTYDGTTTALIATGETAPMYDPGTMIQYMATTLVPQTAVAGTDRIYIEIEATAKSNNHTVTLSFGGTTPTHAHTTLPSVAGTGIVHVINGVFQSPASPVDLTAGATEISGTLPVGNGGTGTSSAPLNGELLIGNGTDYTLATLTDGTNIVVTEGSGSITIDAVPSGAANEIQFNNGGTTFGADPNLTYDGNSLTVATGGSAIDVGLGFVTGTPNLTVETAAGGTLTLGNGDNVDLVAAQEIRVNGDPGAAGEVLTSNGPGAAPTWEAPQVLQSVYVAEGADPAVANGSPAFPYATISAAMASITDATPTKRYAISVGGGAYSEGATFNIKPNVFIVGAAVGAVRITATTFGMDASFSAGAGVDNRSGYQNVILTGACVFDWSAVTSSAGKLYFTSVTFNSAVTMTGHNNTIAQAQFMSCQFFGTLTVSGINVGVFANNVVFANIVLNQHPSLATVLQTAGGYCSGTLTATTIVNTFARRISIFARSFWMGAVTVDGPQTYLDYTVDSLPAAGATVLNGATLVSIDTGTGADKNLSNLNFPTAVNNPIIPAASNATNFGDWGFQWFWSFAFLHASTGTDCYLASYPSAFGAEAGPGKNIYVYADAAGLAADVSGGIVGLYTSNASGTGASGLIEAETGSSANGDSGNIRFTTGTPSGSGRRGTVVVNSPLTHPYGTIAVAAPTATALRTHPTYLTSQAAITLPAMLAADDGLRIEIVTTVPSVVTPPSGAGNQRAMTTRGGSTWIWINGSADWLCISAI